MQEDIVGESNEPLDPYEALLQKRLEHYQAFKKNNYQEVDSSTQTDQDATPTSNAEKTEISDEKTQEAEAILDAISPETILPGSDKPDTSLIDESFTPDTDSTPESQENSDNEFGPIETIEG